MSGRPKQGIDYAGWSVNIFDGDTKIDKLIDAQGWTGFAIYFYLCQMAYKFDGYFYRWGYDDAATTARRMGGGVSSGTVCETVAYCLQIGLFDERTFDGWGVLTSKGIQRRFWAAIEGRRAKSVIKEYWLLKNDECKGVVMCALSEDCDLANEHLRPANDDLHPANTPKSKVKKRKEYDDDNTTRASSPDLGAVMRKYMDLIQAVPPSFVTDLLKDYTEDLSAEVVCYAIEKTAADNIHTWSYVQTILQNYTKKGIRTLAAAQRDAEEFRQAKDKASGARRNTQNKRSNDRMGFLAESIRRDLENDRAGREGDNLPFGDAVGQLQSPDDGS